MSAGLVSRTFGRVHTIGPWLYAEWGASYVHFYARWFWLPEQRGFHWGFALRWRGRIRVFKQGRP